MFKITSRIDGTTEIDQFKTILPAPKSVKISLDDKCQFKCSFCSSSTQDEKAEMDWGMFTKLIDELASEGVQEIGLFYIGEPFIAKKLPEAIRYVKSKGIPYVFVTTNGHLAKRDKVQECMEAGLNSLKFSFNYANGMQLRSVAGVSPQIYQKIVQNIKDARAVRDKYGYECGIYASSILFDGEQGEKMKLAVGLIKPYVDEHYWLPCYSFGGQVEFGQQVRGNPGRLDEMRDPLPCWAVFKEGHVTASGKVSACCFDTHDRWEWGDLTTDTFMQAWNSQQAQELRSAHIKKDVTGTPCEFCAVGS